MDAADAFADQLQATGWGTAARERLQILCTRQIQSLTASARLGEVSLQNRVAKGWGVSEHLQALHDQFGQDSTAARNAMLAARDALPQQQQELLAIADSMMEDVVETFGELVVADMTE